MHLNHTAKTVRSGGEAHISCRPAIHVRNPSWSRTRARLESFADLSGQRAGKSSGGFLRQYGSGERRWLIRNRSRNKKDRRFIESV